MRAPRTPAGVLARARLLLLLAPVAALAAGIALSAQGRVVLHHCVRADGPLALAGVRLAVLESGADCPDGAWALGDVSRGAVVVLGVVVPVLLAHVLLAGTGLGLGAWVRRALRAARALLRTGLPVRTSTPGPLVVPARPAPPAPRVRVRHDRGLVLVRPHRGPPAVV